jgi:HEAT repeats
MKRSVAGWMLVLCGFLLPQESRPGIAWECDFDAVLKAAKADNRPIMIAFIMDDEPSNEEVVKVHFHDKDVVANSKSFHCMIACIGVHAERSSEGACPRYGSPTCGLHQKDHQRAATAYLQSAEISAPQFLFLKPDGETMLLRHVWMLPPDELVRKMRLALGFSDPAKVTEAEKKVSEEVTKVLEEANDNNTVKRVAALAKLAMLDDPRILEFLIKQTSESVDGPRRLEAIDAMGTKGNAKALPVLAGLLKSSSVQIRNHAVVSLEKLAMAECAPAIRNALKNETKDNVRANLVRALAISDPKTPQHVKIITSMIETGGPKERIGALRASLDLSISDSLKKALLTAAKDNSAQIRVCAFCALAKHQVKEAVTLMEKAIPQEKIQEAKAVTQEALAILTKTGNPASPADLMSRLVMDDRLR